MSKNSNIFLPKYIHVLVVDDRIGAQGDASNLHFDYNLKHIFKSQYKSELILHYIDNPADISSKIGFPEEDKDKVIPIDLVIIDINFQRVIDPEKRKKLTGSEISKELKEHNKLKELLASVEGNDPQKIGIELVRYLVALNSVHIIQFPIIVITGDKKYFEKNEDNSKKLLKKLLRNYRKNSNITVKGLPFIKKTDDKSWLEKLTKRIYDEVSDLYNNLVAFKYGFKGKRILERIDKEARYFNHHFKKQQNDRKAIFELDYPRYEILIKSYSKENNNIKLLLKHNDNNLKLILSTKFSAKTLSTYSFNCKFSFNIPEDRGESLLTKIFDIICKIENNIKTKGYEKSFIENKIKDYYGSIDLIGENKSNNNKIEFAGCNFSSPIFIASTPITGFTGGGSNQDEDLVFAFLNKLKHIYDKKKPGGIILKTVSLDETDKCTFDTSVIRNQSTTRCLISKKNLLKSNKDDEGKPTKSLIDDITLLNTGKTKNETINLEQLKTLLDKIVKVSNENFKNSIILNLGSKKYDQEIWNNSFEQLFNNYKDTKYFQLVEINARYTMRGMSKTSKQQDFEVDEYFIVENINQYREKFKKWIELLNTLAIQYNRKLMIKLPFRSDLNILLKIIKDVCKSNEENGIRAISLINTIKSPFLGDHLLGDYHKIPQVSGEQLSSLRNISLYTASKILKNSKIDISASGGIMNKKDIEECKKLGAKTFQISTAMLIDGKQDFNNWIKDQKPILPEEIDYYDRGMKNAKIVRRRLIFYPEKCTSCGNCINTYYCDAFMNKFNADEIIDNNLITKSPIINYDFCTGCGLCEKVCPEDALEVFIENALKETNRNKLYYKGVLVKDEKLQLDKCLKCKNEREPIAIYPIEEKKVTYYCYSCNEEFTKTI